MDSMFQEVVNVLPKEYKGVRVGGGGEWGGGGSGRKQTTCP